MAWDLVKLNDGHTMPSIAFGTWKIGSGDWPVTQVDQAISVGFSHIDTAQIYRNEAEAGKAIRESGLARKDVFITTKYSGMDGLDIRTSISNSLKNIGVTYVDLYLIHHPRLARGDIPGTWAVMEAIQAEGLVKSIGVSNFEVQDLAILLASAKVKPAANQILLHPYVYAQQLPILEYCGKEGIVIEAYSALIPITSRPGGPVDKPLNAIAARLDVTPDQVLLAWTKAKGAVVVTTSSKKSRLEGYLHAGDLELSPDDIRDIDLAGVIGARRFQRKSTIRRVAVATLACAAVLGLASYFGIDAL